MFEVFAFTYDNETTFDKYYLDWEYALQVFNIACKCEDCRSAFIVDATTGELILDKADLEKMKQQLPTFLVSFFSFQQRGCGFRTSFTLPAARPRPWRAEFA